MSFSPSNAWRSWFSVVSSCRLALRVSFALVYSFNLAVDSSNDFISSEVFQPRWECKIGVVWIARVFFIKEAACLLTAG